MDIYGYSSYQYQSDELAKQLFNQQALASSSQYPRPEPVPNTMPVPSGGPWNSQGLSWGMASPPQVVQFTANTFKNGKFNPVMHSKRKSMDMETPIPAKQLITEEKMAAHLNGLHISSQFTSHSLSSDDMWMDTGATTTLDTEKLKGHTIVLSEEVKKIQEEPLLPAVLIERLEKPSMSLVVWKPRDNIIEKIKDQEEKPKEDEFPKKRHGVLVGQNEGLINDVEM